MATGIVKGEKLGEDALLADTAKSEPFPLPSNKDSVELNYPNKLSKNAIFSDVVHSYSSIDRTGKVFPETNINTNAFLLADNFYGLKKLAETHSNKVSLIYLDPPYGTGKDFQSRALKHAYKDVFGTASWSEFMRRRLILMRELLSEDGSIYVHIGHQMLFNLKMIMDEVFGDKNFRNMIVRKKCSSKNYTKNQYPNLNDYILFYSKSDNYIWNNPSVPATEEWINKEYTKVDEKGRYKLVPIHAPGVRNGETGKPWKGMNPPKGKHWQLTPEKLDLLDSNGDIHWSKNGNPRRKVYLPLNKQRPLTDYWDQYRDAHHQSIKITGYPTEKNLDMLKMIVAASSNEGDIVLDPFSGSGTTIHAANDLNRKWIGIDQSFTAAEATLKRIRHGLEEMGDYVSDKKGAVINEAINQQQLFSSEEINVDFTFYVDSDVLNKHYDEVELLAKI
ncbi:site-specific DNA-methyltransferase [Photobacterium phosphoreum]|uniref:site-specific DNA-methyltransferase (adenine-specific) n=1 Tax=Photobacterium phosphoreum TaxID=659 RepID=A0AAW4ZY50_PHOPO|nr:site-specific DNA-methyltransferase [Photobacterium phosphoreum]MCD9490170.1 site-specific DNA-methyltransferase [Photobacterium phosphoreum]MCF2189436.1 site-specific DNA-methyltransferase [Photobacterium phosphoreum]MCF2301226.1 site-specific DNA-methyltransferase [Photobacterium phosphoreum]